MIAAVGSLRAAIDAGLAADGRRILGGDVAIDGGNTPLPDTLRGWLRDRGATISDVTLMRSLLVAPSGERTLIELKAVDAAWPLVGTAEATPPQPIATALGQQDGHYGLLADPLVLDRLGLKPGDLARLGSATLRVAGALTTEPDRVVTPSFFGPRVLISQAALADDRPDRPRHHGALRDPRHRLPARRHRHSDRTARAPSSLRAGGFATRREAAPSVSRFLDQTSLFLTLVGLTSLLVGGIGVANGVGAWLDARGRTIATLRCLGASSGLVLAVCLIQVLSLAAAGILLGLTVGAAVPVAVAWLPEGWLPVPPAIGLYPAPLLLAACFGMLTALCFSLVAARPRRPHPRRRAVPRPDRARTHPPSRLGHRRQRAGGRRFGRGHRRRRRRSPIRAVFLRRRAGDSGLVPCWPRSWSCALARLAPASQIPWIRLGVSNLYRPGAATPLLMLSVGLGLATLATVALIQFNIRQQILEQIPTDAPSFFFVDIQNDQMERFRALANASPRRQRDQGCALAARPRRRHQRRSRRASRRLPRHRLGSERRPRPDLCRDSAGEHAAGGGPMVAARL